MKIKRIISPNNATFKVFLKREGIILSDQDDPSLGHNAKALPLYHLGSDLFNEIDFYGTGGPILLVHVGPFPQLGDGDMPSGCTLCIPFQDPANVGAVIRSAAAFDVSRVVMLKEAAHPFHPKSVRAAGSSLFRVPLFAGPSLDGLKAPKMPVITLSPKGKDVHDYVFPGSFWLVPGMEGQGLPDHMKQRPALSIPMAHGVESLNAALATGIVLYLWQSKLRRG
jgi:tRNA(Leu) C34 or U34 (ribose-2'-O)-methylase TrmL